MKRIHIVEPYHSPAMIRMSAPLVTELALIYEITTGETPDDEADLNYHIPWHSMIGYDKKGLHAIAYTHCNVGAEASLMDACERADLITCMTFTGRQELLDYGVPPEKIWVIYAAADQFIFRNYLIGVIGYPQPTGRKRESIILDLAWKYDLTPYQFLFVGAGWDEMTEKLKSLGVAASHIHADTDELLKAAYRQMDLLLVTGYREGGPLPLLEVMASGRDVLSPAFGYASDLLSEENLYKDIDDLIEKLDKRVAPFVFMHKLARAWRWQDYCAEHALAFGRILGERVDLYPEYGAERYKQLFDIIAEVKPYSLVELGTWNGNRAIQMIQEATKYHPTDEILYQGFDLFEEQTGEQFRRELSKAGWERDLVQRRIEATGVNVELIAGNTKNTIEDLNDADFYFIDGGHSEETVENDADFVLSTMNKKAVVVFDDYYYVRKPPGMGCNKFIDSLDLQEYIVKFLPNYTDTSDGRKIGMVQVTKNADISL